MLRHGVRVDEIATTLGLDDASLVARRWAMLEGLNAAPDHRGEPRTVPRIQATRIILPPGGDDVARVELTPAPGLDRAVHRHRAVGDERARLAA